MDIRGITLGEVSRYNFEKVIRMDVFPHQRGYCRDNIFSLAEAFVFGFNVRTIVVGGVQFGLVSYKFSDDGLELNRILIDYEHQGKGVGKFIIDKLPKLLAFDKGVYRVSSYPENLRQVELLKGLGFYLVAEGVENIYERKL